MIKKIILAAIAVAAVSVSSAQAGPLYLSFGTENGGIGVLNYTGFANYTVSKGSVDLIGNGYFDAYSGNGLGVDSRRPRLNQFGALTTNADGLGTYHVGFLLGGPDL